MTFYEWFEAEEKENGFYCAPGSNVGNFAKKAYQAGAASRDAEVARLKSVPMKYRRMVFNAQLQNENAQLREQVAVLREALKEAVEDYSDRFNMSSQSTNPGIKWIVKQGKEALAATEPKP